MYIVLEGIDGTGKTSVYNQLEKELSVNLNITFAQEPSKRGLGIDIRKLLLHSEHLNSYSELFLFLASRFDLHKTLIEPVIKTKGTIISDRSYISTIAYQCYGRGLYSTEFVEILHSPLEKPDLVIYFSAPIEVCMERLGKNLDRIESEGSKFLEKVKSGYESYFEGKKRNLEIKEVDASKPLPEVVSEVLEILKTYGIGA